jgi:hypothetical protein
MLYKYAPGGWGVREDRNIFTLGYFESLEAQAQDSEFARSVEPQKTSATHVLA